MDTSADHASSIQEGHTVLDLMELGIDTRLQHTEDQFDLEQDTVNAEESGLYPTLPPHNNITMESVSESGHFNYRPVVIPPPTMDFLAMGIPALDTDDSMSDSDWEEEPIEVARQRQEDEYRMMLHSMNERSIEHPARCVVDIRVGHGFEQRVMPFGTDYDSVTAIKCLMSVGIRVTDTTNYWGMTMLHAAAMEGHMLAVGLLLNLGSDIEAKDKYLRTPLHLAAKTGNTEALQLLLYRGANIEASDVGGETPLHLAAYTGHHETVRVLLEEGARPYVAEVDGLTALHLAAGYGRLEVVKVLMDRGVNVDTMNEFLETPLHVAANMGRWAMVEALLDIGASINIKNISRETALHYAVDGDSVKTIQILLHRGADYRAVCNGGLTALRMAEVRERPAIVELISRYVHNATI